MADPDARKAQLQALQSELLALKEAHGRALHLRKTTPAEAPATAPFPITLTVDVEPPPAAANYDIGPITLQMTLTATLLLPQQPGPQAAVSSGTAAAAAASPMAAEQGMVLEVVSDDLPRRLRECIAQQLALGWLQQRSARGTAVAPFALGHPAAELRSRFVPLISLVPGLLEPYQGEDASGATVRRYALVVAAAEEDQGRQQEQQPVPSSSTQATSRPDNALPVASPAPAAVKALPVAAPANVAAGPGASAGATGVPPSPAIRTGTGGAAAAATPCVPSASGTAATDEAGCRPLHPSAAHSRQPKLEAAAPAHPLPPPPPPPKPPPAPSASTAAVTAGAACTPTTSNALPAPRPCPAEAHVADPPGQQAATAAAAAAGVGHRSKPPVTFTDSSSGSASKCISVADDVRASGGARDTADASNAGSGAGGGDNAPVGLMAYDAAAKELQFLAKRYSQVLTCRVHKDDGSSISSTGAAASAHQLLQPGLMSTFELELLPTDPGWVRPPIKVVGQIMPATAGATAASCLYLPSLGIHMACRLPQWLRAELDQYLAGQLAAAATAAATAAAVGSVAAVGALPAALPQGAPAAAGPGVSGRHGHGLPRPARTARGPVAPAAAPVEVPPGTVLLQATALRNILKDLENYAGVIADEAEARQQQAQRPPGASAASGGSSAGSSYEVGSDGTDDDGSGDDDGRAYDDDGYGDGSRRRQADGLDGGDDGGEPAGPDGDSGEEEEDAADEIRFSGAAGSGAAGDVVGTDPRAAGRAGAAAGGARGGGAPVAPSAYAVVLQGMKLDNLAVAEVIRAVFQVACDRCGASAEVTLSSGAVADSGGGGSAGAGGEGRQAGGACAGCHQSYGLLMRTHYLHATSNTLCVLKPQGCRPVDLLPSMLAGQCGSCNAVMTLRGVQVGQPFDRTCSACHREIQLSMDAVSFVPRGPGGGQAGARGQAVRSMAQARAGQGRARGAAANAPLAVGQPLPGLGTCVHYKHSYRWLRFPCCGMRFPCDLCHEEGVTDGHAMRWAQRMVCGFCSTEQPLALECRGCGRKLAGRASNFLGRNTRFWEGGIGCRDRKHMNRNDPHKWAGLHKTKSAKASRVGPKPWSGKEGATNKQRGD